MAVSPSQSFANFATGRTAYEEASEIKPGELKPL